MTREQMLAALLAEQRQRARDEEIRIHATPRKEARR